MLRSFQFAFKGLRLLIIEEPNARFHLLAAGATIALGFLLKIETMEWVAILLCIGLVIAMELINTSIENLSDFIAPKRDEKIGKIKDLAAAAVLVCAIIAVITGCIIFLPKLFFV